MDDGISSGGRPLRLAFLTPSWPPDGVANGVASYVDRICGSLRRMGHQPTIISASGQPGDQWPDVYFLSYDHPQPLARLVDRLTFRGSPGQLRRRYGAALLSAASRAVAERGIDVLEIEETFGLLPLIQPRLSVPVVLRLHGPHFANGPAGNVPHDEIFRDRVRQEGEGIAQAEGVMSCSSEILERTRLEYGLPLPHARVILSPAPIVPPGERWRLEDCDRDRILFVGRFDWHKGGDVLIDSFRILLRTFPKLRLWYVGSKDGLTDDRGRHWTLAQYLEERAPEAAPAVNWLGRLPNAEVNALRRQAFLTVVASRYETFGLVTVEAMAHGCPLVATRTGGIPEVVTDGVNGLLCRPGDAADMAAKIACLLADPELAADLGGRAAEHAAAQFHPDCVAAQIVDYDREVLARRKRPAVS